MQFLLLCCLYLLRAPAPATRTVRATANTLAVRDAKVYPSPDIAPIERATVLVRDGVIAAVGTDIPIPPGSSVVPCKRCVVTAGFWNAHVHFSEPKWRSANRERVEILDARLQDMLTRRGFTTVVDAGSDLSNTVALRERIETGELRGPQVYTAGVPLHPPKGLSYYLKIPIDVTWLMTKPSTPAEAEAMVLDNVLSGADFLKLYADSNSWSPRGISMPVAIAKAAVEAAHRQGQLAYGHASTLAGMRVAMESGIDVLAHAPAARESIDPDLIRNLVDRKVAIVPTLEVFDAVFSSDEESLRGIYSGIRAFHQAGGQLLFGTDVGALTEYDIAEEFKALEQCGLGPLDILRMLTVAPAERFGAAGEKGMVAPGKAADLVVLDGDPAVDGSAFTRVIATVREGRILYQRDHGVH